MQNKVGSSSVKGEKSMKKLSKKDKITVWVCLGIWFVTLMCFFFAKSNVCLLLSIPHTVALVKLLLILDKSIPSDKKDKEQTNPVKMR